MDDLTYFLTLPMGEYITYFAYAIAIASALVIALGWLAGLFQIWHPRHEVCKFWWFFDKSLETVKYISLAAEKITPLLKKKRKVHENPES